MIPKSELDKRIFDIVHKAAWAAPELEKSILSAHQQALEREYARGEREGSRTELKYLDEIFAEYDSKRQVWSVVQSHIRNRKAQLNAADKETKGTITFQCLCSPSHKSADECGVLKKEGV